MSAALALISSFLWGLSDYLGGTASRRIDALRLTALTTPFGLIPLAIFVWVVPGSLTVAAFGYGAVAGLGGVVGILLLYVALAAGPMGVVSPVTAVIGAAIPVLVGLGRGERPGVPAYIGMALAITAIVLVSAQPARDDDSEHHAIAIRTIVIAVGSGVGIGVYLAAIGLAPAGGGIWPVLVARGVTTVVIVGMALVRFGRRAFVGSIVSIAILIGTLDAVANAFYRIAAESGMLAVVSVLGALYPAGTVVLARVFLHERLHRIQQVGMVTAILAAVLLAIPA